MKMAYYIILLIAAAFVIYFLMPKSSSTGEYLSLGEFEQAYEKNSGVVIDVRTPKEFNDGHLEITDYNFDYLSGEFEQKVPELDKNQTYYLYCRTGNRSEKAAQFLREKGFNKVYNIGGFHDLEEAGLSTDSTVNEN